MLLSYYQTGKEGKKMDRYVTGTMIRKLREDRKMTQTELAERLFVSDKTISKWETGVSQSYRYHIKFGGVFLVLRNLVDLIKVFVINLLNINLNF